MFHFSIILYLCWGNLWWKSGVWWLRAHFVKHGFLHCFLWRLEGFLFHFLKGRYMYPILYHKLILCCSLKVEVLQGFTLIAHFFDVVLRMALWKLHYVEIFPSNHIPPKRLQWIWKWHDYDIWISSMYWVQ